MVEEEPFVLMISDSRGGGEGGGGGIRYNCCAGDSGGDGAVGDGEVGTFVANARILVIALSVDVTIMCF